MPGMIISPSGVSGCIIEQGAQNFIQGNPFLNNFIVYTSNFVSNNDPTTTYDDLTVAALNASVQDVAGPYKSVQTSPEVVNYNYKLYVGFDRPFTALELKVGSIGSNDGSGITYSRVNALNDVTVLSGLSQSISGLLTMQTTTAGIISWNSPSFWNLLKLEFYSYPLYWIVIEDTVQQLIDGSFPPYISYIRYTTPP